MALPSWQGADAFPAILHALGVPAPHLMGWLTILVEIFGGLAVLLGALVPLASISMAAVLLVAIFTVHLPYGFSSIKLLAVTAAGTRFGPPGFEPVCSTSPALRPSPWGLGTIIDRGSSGRAAPPIGLGQHVYT
jgi:hypothetical protein